MATFADAVRAIRATQADILQKRVEMLEKERQALQTEISEFNEHKGDDCIILKDDNNGNALTNKDDQKRIYAELAKLKGQDWALGENTLNTFFHVDNVRYIFAGTDQPVPQWFRDKYGHKFVQKTETVRV